MATVGGAPLCRAQAGVPYVRDLTANVEITVREGGERRYTMILNNSD